MRVRRFTASSMQKALKTVRDEMGPDAVILSNHRVKGGVEIIVAQNYEPSSAKTSAPPMAFTEDGEVDDSHLPSPTFSRDKNTQERRKEKEPWPFLSDDERKQVNEQLQLQEQLETMKRQRDGGSAKTISASQDKEALRMALDEMKTRRDSQLDPVQPLQREPKAQQKQERLAMLDDMRNELHDLKEMLCGDGQKALQQPANFVWKKYAPANALQAKFWQRLENMGFDDWVIYQLVHDVVSHADEKGAWQLILQDLVQHMNISPSDRLKRGGVYAMVGPTGAGKTTTIAKMAVRFTLEHENASIGLVTMDNYRLAAHDQLKTLGQILGVPVQVADQEHTLSKCLDELSDCDLVLIDTAGLTPQHPMLNYQLEQLASLRGRVHTLLTLPATSTSRVLRKVYHNYKAAGIGGCVLTKLDEASSLGDALSALLESGLDLSYATDGQRIPDDFHVASAKALVKRAVVMAKQEQASQDEAEAQGVWS
ncbi:flagellar biosynthesis protein FlhF [Bermanella marisrubri]|uniref:Flagellar biosynthesis protein FlhF n=1 Tax=Bermanella marisrubri TaxID=207949 RepID=Q1N2U7_9GAMM|nr:flagellar biosynthesis protein FlhF [Bermanella marisrubri]EAT12572.1 flagellar biosynthesis regulator FlhF [Oceanobacter sp. RED65] [Bermanella marisrubri]QIZ84871.1 flagellar biosynthesis protein FlhF [Bermanella marisrubri]